MNGAWKTIGVALEATTAGYTGGMLKAAAVTDKFGESAAKARLEAEKPPSAAGWEAFATKTEALGKKMTKNVTVPILAFGAAAVAAAVQVDGAYHTIEQRTGATGAKLQGLKHDFDEVNKTSGASMAHIADVMSQFNQRLGLSGAPLQTFTKDFLVLERVAGAGAPTVEQAATVMVAWKVATDDQAATLDKLFVASQRTGVPMNTLIDDVTRFAPQMRAAGYTIDQTAAFMGTLEKAGVPVGKVMMGVNTFLAQTAKDGGDAHGALQKVIDKAIELDKVDATGQQAATYLATQFSSRTAVALSQLIKDGRISGDTFAQLERSISGSDGAIQKVGAATVPLSVRLKQAWKTIELAIAPIGQVILPDLMGVLHNLIPVIGGVAGAFAHLPHAAQEWVVGLGLALAAMGPVMTAGVKMWKSLAAGAAIAGKGVDAVSLGLYDLVGTVGLVGAGIAALTVVGTAFAGFQMFEAFAHGGDEVKQMTAATEARMKHLGLTVDTVFSKELHNTALGKSLKDGGLIDYTNKGIAGMFRTGQDAESFNAVLKTAGVTVGDVTTHLKQGKDAYNEWVREVLRSNGAAGSGFVGVLHGDLEVLGKAYKAADDGGRGFAKAVEQVKTGLTASGVATRDLNSDSELLMKAKADDGYMKQLGKAKITLLDVAVDAKALGYTLADALKVDPSILANDKKELDKFVDSVKQNITGSGQLTSIPQQYIDAGANGLKLYYTKALKQATDFTTNLRTATANGLNPQAITDLMVAGPEKAGPILEAMVGKHGKALIQLVNVFQTAIAKQTMLAADQARILYDATQGPLRSQQRVADLPTAMKISAITQAGTTPLTANQVAWMTGLDPATVQRVARDAGLDLAHGLANALDSHPATPTLNFGPAHAQLKTLQYTVNKTTGQVTVGATPIPANTELAKLLKAIGHSRGDVTLDANQQIAVVKLQALIDAINNSKGKVILDADPGPADQHIKTLGEEIGRIPFVGSALAASLKYQATDPRLVSQGAPTHKADGGIEHHTAQIAPAGAWRVWAEPETGGESYIPLAPSKRSRSIDIWHKTGKLLGVHGFADGGTAWVDESAIAAPAERALGKFLALEQATAASGAPGAPWNGSVGSIAAAQAFAAAQVGKPYSWGAVGPNAYDCSGYWSAIVNVLEGRHPYSRLFTSATLPGVAGSLGLSAGGGGPLSIGDKPGSHVAGTINGVNYEATPPFVRSGPHARGSGSSFFSRQFHIGGSSGLGGGFGGAPSATGGDPGATLFGNGGIVWHGNNFDVGGPLWPGWNAVRNDTGRVEHVVPTGHGGGHGGGVTYAPRVEVKILAPVYGIDDLNAAITDGVHATFRDEYPKIVHEVRRQEDSRR